jgi:hypothetical protein
VGGATRKKEEGDLVERDVEGTRMRPDVRQLRWSGGDRCWSGGVSIVQERGSARGPRRRAWADRGREGVGPGPRATVLILI